MHKEGLADDKFRENLSLHLTYAGQKNAIKPVILQTYHQLDALYICTTFPDRGRQGAKINLRKWRPNGI